MANTYNLTIGAIYKGGQAFQKAIGDVAKLNDTTATGSKSVVAGMKSMHVAALGVGAGIGAAGVAVKKFYDTARAGAVLQTTTERFDNLALSIGTTADALLGKLRKATQGMISDAELMAGASQIMSLGLAKNEDQVVRLATVVGTLGWDMNQVILTFANMSTMRLDALGLSVEEVKNKAKELEATGMSAQDAFKEAVILAGEARLDVGGVGDAEKAFLKAEAAVKNYRDSLTQSIALTLEQAGAFERLSRAADNIGRRAEFEVTIAKLYELGEAGGITEEQFKALSKVLEKAGIDAAENALQNVYLTGEVKILTGAVGENVEAYRVWSGATSQAMKIASDASAEATRGILIDMEAIQAAAEEAIRLFGGAASSADAAMLNSVSNWQMNQDPLKFGNPSRRAYWEHERMKKAAEGMRGYSSVVSEVTQAEQALAAAHARLADAFSSELTQKAEDGLIDAAGAVNIENANKALYDQAKAAGATAAQLAMLGMATGLYTEEQTQAALKAAILAEKIRLVAQQAVATGDMGGAVGAIQAFKEQLDSGQITDAAGSIEGLASAADDLAGTYTAELTVEDQAALTAVSELQQALNDLANGTYNVTIGVSAPAGAIAPPMAAGGPVTGGRPYLVGEVGPELFVPGRSGQIVPNRDLQGLVDGRGGGATYNVHVTNYIQGGSGSTRGLQTAVEDGTFAALKRVGIGGNR